MERFSSHRHCAARVAGRKLVGPACLEFLESRGLLSGTVHLGVVGDLIDNSATQSVAKLIASWKPDAIFTVGDNTYSTDGTAAYDDSVGQNFHQYLYPYTGSYGSGAADHVNHFFPALGNHDWDNSSAQSYFQFFTLPNNERYYDVTIGSVEVFLLDSDTREPGGTSSGSTQGKWLQSELAASSATWKLVICHHPPYTSGSMGNNSYMQWPFAQWGATAVFSGHDHLYERLSKNGIPYIVDGLGGSPILDFGSTISGSQVRYNDDYGAMLLTATDTSLNAQFITESGDVIDSLTLGQVAPPTVPATPSNLAATASSSSQIKLTWTDNASNETGFKLERSSNGTTFTQIATPAAGATSYTDSGLSASTKYYYRVKATNTAGDSGYSGVANATTLAPSALTYLSDLTWSSATVGWGTVHKDASIDGNTLTLSGATSAKGIGTHAASQIVYNLAGQYASFLSDVGVDDEVGSNGSVAFQVLADGVKVYDSGVLTGASVTQSLNLSVKGVSQLTLVVTNGGDDIDYDHADWANARLSTTSQTAPAAPSGLAATAVSSSQISLAWTDNASNETGFKLERSADGTTFTQVATPAAGATSYTDSGLSASTKYYYRLRATNGGGDSGYSGVANATTLAGTGGGSIFTTNVDIGSPALAGSSAVANGVYTVKGGGADIWGTSDQFQFDYKASTGDVTLITRVSSLTNTNTWAKAGLMLRNGTAVNAQFVDILVTPSNGVAFQYRTATGGVCSNSQVTGVTAPTWLKLTRSGNTFIGYYSSDGITWKQVGTAQTIATGSILQAGLVVTSHDTTKLATAIFDNVAVSA